MQRFPCPFCGPRAETEFHFAVEAGHPRPDGAPSDADWAAYLYDVDAPKGPAREMWLHVTCGTYFLMTRDTQTREILGAEDLG
ncbi:sarcosine oxidase subunit delta [Hasllibacter sp. MH4015]|uniref:sarcosine oxidase subunit delta n=1 Tax=Hasllibacter sp. MH4015 TaxID=2854029 RepID=UPI001CD4F8DC|nr:sarcosine oxidase subunit delta [Hasllibacter sp. MH4015]